jgi:hypothetical protein
MRHNRLSTAAAELSTAESPEESAVSTPSQQVAHRLSTEVTAQVTIVFRSVASRSLHHTTLSRTRHPQRTDAHPHPGNKLRTGYPQARGPGCSSTSRACRDIEGLCSRADAGGRRQGQGRERGSFRRPQRRRAIAAAGVSQPRSQRFHCHCALISSRMSLDRPKIRV